MKHCAWKYADCIPVGCKDCDGNDQTCEGFKDIATPVEVCVNKKVSPDLCPTCNGHDIFCQNYVAFSKAVTHLKSI